ncbi:hypothetical protein [Pulveribacter sp.]
MAFGSNPAFNPIRLRRGTCLIR